MVNILIHGFPHCGTTILRAILGNNSEIYEYPYETETVDDIKCFAKGKHIVIKSPFTKPEYFGDAYKQYIKIFVLRNPYHVFTSLNTRFEYNIPANHSIDTYLETAKLFQYYVTNPRNDVICLKYEEMFTQNFSAIRAIFDRFNIPYTDDVFNNTERSKKILPGVKAPSYKPSSTGERQHATYRTWQINQPFVYTDNLNVVKLLPHQEDALNNAIVQTLGYTNT